MIITLSSIPPRYRHLRPTLDSLLRQRLRAEQIILYIPQSYRRFPDWDGKLPIVPEGVEICRVSEDFGPATKVLPAVRQFHGKDIDVLFCDDDVAYDRDWSSRFAAVRTLRPDVCVVEAGKDISSIRERPSDRLPRMHRGRSRLWRRITRKSSFLASGYCDLLMGVGGGLVRPDFFTERVFDIPDMMWPVDDIWLSGQLELNRVPIWLNAKAPRRKERRSKDVASLRRMIHAGHGRNDLNAAGIAYLRKQYGIWNG
jgi:hypothetical protein